MKRFIVIGSLALSSIAFLPAATCQQAKQDIKYVLDGTQAACVLANAMLPDVPAIATACGIDAALVPAIEQYLLEFAKRGLVPPKNAVALVLAKHGVSLPAVDAGK